MSKKYIIEIKPDYEGIAKGIMILGAKEDNLFVDTIAVENLEELNSDYINEHFSDLQDTAYQKGFEDGKAVNDKGCEGCKYGGTPQGDSQCFNCSNYYNSNWTAKDDKIEVGDEVVSKHSGIKGILLEPETEDVTATIIVPSQRWRTIYDAHVNLKKTGKHYDIEKLLEVMKA